MAPSSKVTWWMYPPPPPLNLSAAVVLTDCPIVLKQAKAEAEELSGKCTALHQVTDVDIMRNPSKNGKQRPGTFAHSCVIWTGPIGCTLLQHIEEHDNSFPMTLADGETWIRRFEEFATQCGGMWTEKANDADPYVDRLVSYILLYVL